MINNTEVKTVYDRVAVFLYVFVPSANVPNMGKLVWNGERWVFQNGTHVLFT